MAYQKRNPAAALGGTGLPQSVLLGGERSEDNSPLAVLQHRLLLIRQAHTEALGLGARDGHNADCLALHFARQHRAAFTRRAA